MNQHSRHLLLHGEAGAASGTASGEGGYVIPMVGLLLVPLMVVTALAIDVGSWYAKGTELQRAVDMAAMAGVVWLPTKATADTEATATLQRNGFTSANWTSATFTSPVGGDFTKYKVTVTIATERFFSGVLGSSTQPITRTSTAQYNKPVPLGSPQGVFGNNLPGDLNGDGDLSDPGECGNPQGGAAACNASSQPQLWAAINGPYEDNENGDSYATRCLANIVNTNPGACSSPSGANPEFRGTYTYIIETFVPNQQVTVQVYDAPTYNGVSNNYTQDRGNFRTGYEVFNEDGSALTVSTTPALSLNGLCSAGPGRRVFPGGYQANTYHNRWFTLCTFTAATPGQYPLVVSNSYLPGDSSTGSVACPDDSTRCTGDGINGYSVRATAASGTAPRLYGYGDMSIWNVAAGSVANFYLADVQPVHAGKKFILDMYDPGDGSSGTFTMEINGPGGADYNCTLLYGTANGLRGNTGGGTENYPGQCSFQTRNSSGNRFNDRWVRVEIAIPTGYTCSSDCWWKVNYNFGTGSPTDRTVWAVAIVGDPVHLTE